ncbi:MAG TPA: zinc ribbon domain-containing protein [Methylomirabilota bacterium]|nr:zinc ribbon domain-containing protein [Methylomirabilota bacterium]
MPIYEYHCLACGEAFEKLLFGQAPGTTIACPGCASADVARTLSVFGVKTTSGVASSRGGSGGGGCCGPGGCGCR